MHRSHRLSFSANPFAGLPTAVVERLEGVLEQFEDAWRQGHRPQIADYLPPGGTVRRLLVLELALEEMEYRHRYGEPVRAEDYLDTYSELQADQGAAVELIAWECLLRGHAGASLPMEYVVRFPRLAEAVAARLQAAQSGVAAVAVHTGEEKPTVVGPPPSRKEPVPATPQQPKPLHPATEVATRVLQSGTAPPAIASAPPPVPLAQVPNACLGVAAVPVRPSGPPNNAIPPPVPTIRPPIPQAPVMVSPQALPAVIGRFQVRARLGSGGFGTVYRAYDPQLDREVALKVPLPGTLDEPQMVQRFLREARAAAQLRHPHIVPIFETGGQPPLLYIASAFVEGRTLAALCGERSLPFKDAAGVVQSLAEALAYAHGKGVVHRDVKPSNVMVDSKGAAHLLDFGLAYRREGGEKLTQEGALAGTPAYMAPERVTRPNEEPTAAGDQYSVGVLLYELLCGRAPFEGPAEVVLFNAVHTEPAAPRRLSPKLPLDLEVICLKAMAKRPQDRYTDCRELAEDLRRWREGKPVLARPLGRVGRLVRWARRSPVVASLTAAVLLVFAVGATVVSVLAALAVATSNDLKQSNDDLLKSNDESLTRLARSHLAALGLESPRFDRSVVPLLDGEIKALWELAGSPQVALQQRFIEEAIRGQATTQQLKNRRTYALNATVGLDLRRRQAVEKALSERMSAQGVTSEEKTDLALTLATLGDLTPRGASGAAATLTQAFSKTTDLFALQELAEGMLAVAPRLQPKEAKEAAVALSHAISKPHSAQVRALPEVLSAMTARLDPERAKEVAAKLSQVISTNTNPNAWQPLAEGMSAVAARLEPKEELAACREVALTFTQAISKIQVITTNRKDRQEKLDTVGRLAGGLSAVVARLKPKEAREMAAMLSQAINKNTDAYVLPALVQGLSAVAACLEPKEAAGTLILAISKTSMGEIECVVLAQRLLAVVPRLNPKEAKEVAATLIEAISKSPYPYPCQPLMRALSAIAARLEPEDAKDVVTMLLLPISTNTHSVIPQELAQGLSAVAARLEPEGAKEVAATLTHALRENKNPSAWQPLAQTLSAVAARQKPREAAATLTQAISKTTDPSALPALAEGLSAAARLEPKETTAACREAAATLSQAIRTTNNPVLLRALAQGLSAVADRLEPREAAVACREAAVTLTQAIRKAQTSSKNPKYNPVQDLAQSLSAVAAHLAPEDAKETAASLTAAISKTTDPFALRALAEGLSAVAARMEPKEAVVTLSQASSKNTHPNVLWALAQGVLAVAVRLESEDAKEVAAMLSQTIRANKNPSAWQPLAQALSAVANRLKAKEAVAVCGQAAMMFSLAIRENQNPSAWQPLVQGLSAVGFHLGPEGAKEVAATLSQAISTNTNPHAVAASALGLSAVAAHLEPKDAKEVARTLSQAIIKNTHGYVLGALAEGLSAVADRLEPEEAATVCKEAAVTLLETTDNRGWVDVRALTRVLSAGFLEQYPFSPFQRAVALVSLPAIGNGVLSTVPLLCYFIDSPCRLSTPQLVELLKTPLCVGEPRRTVLAALGARYKRHFADQWEFVHFAEEHKLDLDFTAPPERPVALPIQRQ